MKESNPYDLVIIGAGVSGAAQYFAAAKYTNLKNVLLLEKEPRAGNINSAATNNSQTLHEGDIETNYSLEKATATKHKAGFTRRYLEAYPDHHGQLYLKGPKMVLGVGAAEVRTLEERYQTFSDLFPTLQQLGPTELAAIEPKLMAGRTNQMVIALYNEDGITVNYAALATQLIADANETWSSDPIHHGTARFNSYVTKIEQTPAGYTIHIGQDTIYTRFLSVCAGAHSMYFAKQLAVPEVQDVSLLLVAGNFYYTPKYLNAKVYTLQDPQLPFSAVHADPDILHQDDKNRYGPTTRIVLQLERGRFGTTVEYLSTISPFLGSLLAYGRILGRGKFFWYALKHNFLFTIPVIGNYLFVKTARKIIPTLKYRDLTLARGQGGVRPQIVQSRRRQPLDMGEAKFWGTQAFFNVTPSPGASTALYNGLVDIRKITTHLNATFDTHAVERDFALSLSESKNT